MKKYPVTRRRFLAGAAAVSAVPLIIPASALGRGKRPAPSERINVGMIGYGTMGHDNIGNFLNDERCQLVAVCDVVAEGKYYGYNAERSGGHIPGMNRVNKFYAEKTGKPDYKGCRTFVDFREMIEKADVDAVVISVPDHWHCVMGIYAARKGKHIYGQKPLSLTIGEGRALCNAVKEAGVTFQTGSQRRSEDYNRMACEFVRNGRLGTLDRIEVGIPGGYSTWGKTPDLLSTEPLPKPPPHVLDFDLWLGPAPKRPFIPALHYPLIWRWNFEYSGGYITDWGAHFLDIVQWALDEDDSGPVQVNIISGKVPPPESIYNTAESFEFELIYAEGTRVLVSNTCRLGITFIGKNGKEIFTGLGKLETKPAELVREKIRDDEIKLFRNAVHERNFIDCIYSGKRPLTDCEIGHRSITLAHLANIAYRLGRKTLKWDPVKELVPDDPKANALKHVPLRAPWVL